MSDAAEKPKRTPEELAEQRRANLEKGRETRRRNAEARRLARLEADGAAETEPAPPPPSATPEPKKETTVGPFSQMLVKLDRRKNGAAAHSPEQREDEDEEDAYPTIEQIVEQTREPDEEADYSIDDAVPPPEMDPTKLERPTMQPAEVHDFVGELPTPKRFEDLMSHLAEADWGSGQWMVTVERKSPKNWHGVLVAGELTPIRRPIDRAEFINTYGGGEFILILYGPPKRGAARDPDGRPRFKPYTQPVKYTLSPHHYGCIVPPDEDVDDEPEDDPTMRTYGTAFTRGPRSNADAKIHEQDRLHEREMLDRQERREREEREQRRRDEQEAERRGVDVAELIANRAQHEAEMAERRHEREIRELKGAFTQQMEMVRNQLEEQMHRPSETQDFGKALAAVLGALNQNKEGVSQAELSRLQDQATREREALTKARSDERDSLTKQHAQQIESMRAEHGRELKGLQDRADERVRQAEARALEADRRTAERVKEVEEKAERRIRELESRQEERVREIQRDADKRVEEAERRAERTVTDVRDELRKGLDEAHRHAEQRMKDEERNHQRDMRAKDESTTMRLESQKQMYENRISTLNDRVTQLVSEVERMRGEIERAKDLPGQVAKLKETAELLGMREGDGVEEAEPPKDWKELVFRLGMKLPEMFGAAGETLMQIRQQGVPQLPPGAHQQGAYAAMMNDQGQPGGYAPQGGLRGQDGAPFYAQPPLAFGTEDGPDFYDEPDDSPPPRSAGPPVAPPGPQAPQAPRAPPSPPPQQQQQAPRPPPAPPRPPAQAAPPPQPPPGQVDDAQLAHWKTVLEGALAAGVPPDLFAQQFVQEVGPQMAAYIHANVSPERIIQVVQQQPGGAQSPIVRRDGTKWLRQVWAKVGQFVGAAA